MRLKLDATNFSAAKAPGMILKLTAAREAANSTTVISLSRCRALHAYKVPHHASILAFAEKCKESQSMGHCNLGDVHAGVRDTLCKSTQVNPRLLCHFVECFVSCAWPHERHM